MALSCLLWGAANVPHEVLKSGAGMESVEARIYIQINHPIRMLRNGLHQPIERSLFFAEIQVVLRNIIRRNKLSRRALVQHHLDRLLPGTLPTGLCMDLLDRKHSRWGNLAAN